MPAVLQSVMGPSAQLAIPGDQIAVDEDLVPVSQIVEKDGCVTSDYGKFKVRYHPKEG